MIPPCFPDVGILTLIFLPIVIPMTRLIIRNAIMIMNPAVNKREKMWPVLQVIFLCLLKFFHSQPHFINVPPNYLQLVDQGFAWPDSSIINRQELWPEPDEQGRVWNQGSCADAAVGLRMTLSGPHKIAAPHIAQFPNLPYSVSEDGPLLVKCRIESHIPWGSC